MLSGNLEKMNLAEVLRLLCASGQNGSLEISLPPYSGSIYIKLGELVHASSSKENAGDSEKTGLEAIAFLCKLPKADFIFNNGEAPHSESLTRYETKKIISSIAKHVNHMVHSKLPDLDTIPVYQPEKKLSTFTAPSDALALLYHANGSQDISSIAKNTDNSPEFVQKWMGYFQKHKVVEIKKAQVVAPVVAEPVSKQEQEPKAAEPPRYWRGKQIN